MILGNGQRVSAEKAVKAQCLRCRTPLVFRQWEDAIAGAECCGVRTLLYLDTVRVIVKDAPAASPAALLSA